MIYSETLRKITAYAKTLGLNVVITNELDQFFKGDMDGLNIFCRDVDDEEELFNVLHMIGHSVQWNTDPELRKLGSQLYNNPDANLLRRLQEYEWEANCYALFALHQVGIYELDSWLYDKYIKDMNYLTHFYMTGEKVRFITPVSLQYSYSKEIVEKEIPPFTPVKDEVSRNGLVIDF